VSDKPDYMIALFKSVHHVLMSEKILKKEEIPHKLIPVPKVISADCGVCIRFKSEHTEIITKALTGRAEDFTIQQLIK
jgi:hypothetical protein